MRSFWKSLPGVLTGIAAILTAVASLYVAIYGEYGKSAKKVSGQGEDDLSRPVALVGQIHQSPENSSALFSAPTEAATAKVAATEVAAQSSRETALNSEPKTSVGTEGAAEPFSVYAEIDDPDGYTNVRSSKSATSQIVVKIYANDRFRTYYQDGPWWQVKTKDGKVGYMHVSRIKVIGPRP